MFVYRFKFTHDLSSGESEVEAANKTDALKLAKEQIKAADNDDFKIKNLKVEIIGQTESKEEK